MNKQKRFNTGILLIITSILFISGNLLAQQQPQQHPPMPPDSNQISQMVDELSTELSLTEDQQANILELFTDHFNEMKAAMDNKQDQQGNREEMDRLRRDFENKVKSLLNDEQKAGFDEYMDNHGPQHKQQRPKR